MIQATTKKIESLKQMKAASLISMFPQAGETTPRVRFKGFEGEWIKTPLVSIAKFNKGNGYSKKDILIEGHPIILYGRLYTKYETVIDKVDTFALLKDNSVLSEENDIIVPASGETPEDIACASVVKNKSVILGGDLNIIKLNKKYDPVFTALNITYGEVHFELAKYAQGKSVVHLHNSDLAKISIMYPIDIKEQELIASYFKSLDKLISLQEQRLKKMKQIKAACLDKMFV
jgi:type I restriction enzyme S subunit